MISKRYNRQVLLKGFGARGQENLNQSKVLVIGAGGLGCPVLQILAASGIGTIGIVDDDRINPDNLNRQILYKSEDIGQYKTPVAAQSLRKLNPEIQILEHNFRLSNQNALETFKDYDIIVDGTDNFESRYMINDAAYLLGKPLVYGAISEYEGQLGVWNLEKDGIRSLNYRDAFPVPPRPGAFQNCNELGVLGVLTSIIGSLMAAEVIKMASRLGDPLINRIFTYNVLNHKTYEFSLKPSRESLKNLPGDPFAFRNMDYGKFCGIDPVPDYSISQEKVEEWLKEGNTLFVDVREKDELPVFTLWNPIQIPLGKIRSRATEIQSERIIVFCFSGKRSSQAVGILKEVMGPDKPVYSLEGGLMKWKYE